MSPQGKERIKILLKTIVSVILMAWLVKTIEWGQIANLLRNARLSWLLLAFLFVIISVLVSAYKWQLICRASGLKCELKELWKIYWCGLFFNNFMPSSIGGDALRIYWAGRYTGDATGTGTSVVVERVLATVGLSFLGLLAAPLVQIQVPYLKAFFIAMILGSLFVLVLILSPLSLLMSRLFAGFPKVTALLNGLNTHGSRLRSQKGLIFMSLLWSVIFQFCVVMVNISILHAFCVDRIALLEACLIIPATSVAAMIPIGINGYGTREGAYAALFAYFGVNRAEAIAVSVVFALIVTISSLWGGWLWFRNEQNLKGQLFQAEA
ncbi:hypothetical protein SPSYN_02937 [Sporotomaculum syntrophicum]|uniref:Phosphatidylglycerol lysyltransferase n=1 Tax=Sporotomaculum syntrophicum TaxID=182264 RepID=A0A9D3AVF2_9FIRM|nr:lysylphosphatidylglycerol synthase transmembrane domain-containing protein [Sporotomaculum syntrophicum]KAF1084025.1 hypothetical protein SPSYN_02937 [Sporotomaculum syntrophicum]